MAGYSPCPIIDMVTHCFCNLKTLGRSAHTFRHTILIVPLGFWCKCWKKTVIRVIIVQSGLAMCAGGFLVRVWWLASRWVVQTWEMETAESPTSRWSLLVLKCKWLEVVYVKFYEQAIFIFFLFSFLVLGWGGGGFERLCNRSFLKTSAHMPLW